MSDYEDINDDFEAFDLCYEDDDHPTFDSDFDPIDSQEHHHESHEYNNDHEDLPLKMLTPPKRQLTLLEHIERMNNDRKFDLERANYKGFPFRIDYYTHQISMIYLSRIIIQLTNSVDLILYLSQFTMNYSITWSNNLRKYFYTIQRIEPPLEYPPLKDVLTLIKIFNLCKKRPNDRHPNVYSEYCRYKSLNTDLNHTPIPYEEQLLEFKNKIESETKQYEKQYWQYIMQEQSYHETMWLKLPHPLSHATTTEWLQLSSLSTISPTLFEEITTSTESFFKIFIDSFTQPTLFYSPIPHELNLTSWQRYCASSRTSLGIYILICRVSLRLIEPTSFKAYSYYDMDDEIPSHQALLCQPDNDSIKSFVDFISTFGVKKSSNRKHKRKQKHSSSSQA
jgi:hypothetical protein